MTIRKMPKLKNIRNTNMDCIKKKTKCLHLAFLYENGALKYLNIHVTLLFSKDTRLTCENRTLSTQIFMRFLLPKDVKISFNPNTKIKNQPQYVSICLASALSFVAN